MYYINVGCDTARIKLIFHYEIASKGAQRRDAFNSRTSLEDSSNSSVCLRA